MKCLQIQVIYMYILYNATLPSLACMPFGLGHLWNGHFEIEFYPSMFSVRTLMEKTQFVTTFTHETRTLYLVSSYQQALFNR